MRGIEADVEERNYAKAPLTQDELEEILAVADVSEVLNTRHAIAKERGWATKAPSKSAFIAAVLAEDQNLLRRPILIRGKKISVGKDEEAIRRVLAGK